MTCCSGINMSADLKRSQSPLISVVDDDVLMQESTTRLLRSFKFNVKALASAEEFLNSDSLAETACLILDLRLPGMSGLELQRQLISQNRRMPIIFVTAQGDETQQTQALGADAVAFLYKSFDEHDLLNAINSALGNS
ncbi:MAG TPA: response regulator [Chthoniobacterales bacterium]|nr:response regulator [Chthoniobacterales bacterium]